MINLKDAQKTGKIDEFVKEHKGDPKGDPEVFNRTVEVMAKKSKATHRSWTPDVSDD